MSKKNFENMSKCILKIDSKEKISIFCIYKDLEVQRFATT